MADDGVSLIGAFDSSELKSFIKSPLAARNNPIGRIDVPPPRFAEHVLITFTHASVEPVIPNEDPITEIVITGLNRSYVYAAGSWESLLEIRSSEDGTLRNDSPLKFSGRGRGAGGFKSEFTEAALTFREISMFMIEQEIEIVQEFWQWSSVSGAGTAVVAPVGTVPGLLQYTGLAGVDQVLRWPRQINLGDRRPYYKDAHIFGSVSPRMRRRLLSGNPPSLVVLQNLVKDLVERSGAINRIRIKRELQPDENWQLALHLGFAQPPVIPGDDPRFGSQRPLGWQFVFDFVERLDQIQAADPNRWPWQTFSQYGITTRMSVDDTKLNYFWLNLSINSLAAIVRSAGLGP